MTATPWAIRGDSLLLACHIQPGARQNRIVGLHNERLKIQLKAPPVEGRANAMLIRFVAEILALPRSRISIKQGLGSRQKTIQINGISEIPENFLEFLSD